MHECFLPSAPWLALKFQHKQTKTLIDSFYFIDISFNQTIKIQKIWTVCRRFPFDLQKDTLTWRKFLIIPIVLTMWHYSWLAIGIVSFICDVATYAQKIQMTSLCKWASCIFSNKGPCQWGNNVNFFIKRSLHMVAGPKGVTALLYF